MGKLCKNIEQSILEYTHKARKRVEERQQNLSGPQPLLCHFQCSIFHFFTWKLWCCSKIFPALNPSYVTFNAPYFTSSLENCGVVLISPLFFLY
jgi:hypothetical protein